MVTFRRALAGFVREEGGAVTIDWVALTSGILLLGTVVVFSIFGNGVSPLTANVNDTLSGANAGVCSKLEAGLGLNEGDCDTIAGR